MDWISRQYCNTPEGETLSYCAAGTGPKTVFLIHGNGASSLHFLPFLQRLPEDCKAYALDLRGFGESSYCSRIRSLQDFSDDLLSLIHHVGQNDFTLVGWSLGGGVAMQFALDHPGYASRLVLISSIPHFGIPFAKNDPAGASLGNNRFQSMDEMAHDPHMAAQMRAIEEKDPSFIQNVWNTWTYPLKKPPVEYESMWIQESLKQKDVIAVNWAIANFNLSDAFNGYSQGNGRIHDLAIPVLALWGDHDKSIPREWVEQTVAAIGNRAVMKTLQQCGHSPMVDCPEVLMEEIIRFVEDPGHLSP